MADNTAELTRLLERSLEQISLQQQQIDALIRGRADPGAGTDAMVIERLSRSIMTYKETKELAFEDWYSRYEDVFLKDADCLDDAGRARLLHRKLDDVAFSKFTNRILPKKPKDLSFSDTVKQLKDIFKSDESLFAKRIKCLRMEKSPLDDLDTHSGKVNRMCEESAITSLTADVFKAIMFTVSLKDSKYSEVVTHLLNKMETVEDKKVTLDFMTSEAKRMINLKVDTQIVESPTTGTVNVVHKGAKNKFSKPKPKTENRSPRQSSDDKPSMPCWLCGNLHHSDSCTYKTHKCKTCDKTGHRDGYCKSAARVKKGSPAVKGIQINHVMVNRKYVHVKLNNVDIELQLDSGSDVTIISKSNWIKIGSPNLAGIQAVIKDAQLNHMRFLGEFTSKVSFQGKQINGRCFVSENDCNLFGIEWITGFDLWSQPPINFCNSVVEFNRDDAVSKIKAEFADIFSKSLGFCTKATAKLQLKPAAVPTFKPKRPVPFHFMAAVDEELTRLESLGVISPVDSSDYAAPVVVVRKPNGTVRICGDYSTGLNASLEPNYYPIPTLDELYGRLINGRVFATIDLSDAYLNVGVCEESKKLLTIHTHKGLYNFNRLAPGIRSAPGIFQRIADQLVSNLPNVVAYFDDICIAAVNEEELYQSIRAVLNRIREFGFHIREPKCKFFMEEVNFLGNIISKEGIRPNPDKIAAVIEMPPPTNVNELRSFLGAINFYAKYIKGMSNLTAPLSHLLKNNVEWNWSKQCQSLFEKFKKILLSDLILTHYQPELPLQVAADASSLAIGAQLSHIMPDGSVKAVYYASRTLTIAERSYSQIEREALGLIFAVQRFHRFIYGREFTLSTDHKPLLAIFGSKKGLAVHAANRIQRWQIILHKYDFKVEFVPTAEFGHVDVLSRLIADKPPCEEYVVACTRFEDLIRMDEGDIFKRFPIGHQHIKTATKSCDELQLLQDYILNGWPSNKTTIHRDVMNYYKVKDSLTASNSCLYYRNRLIIPHKYRTKILKRLHEAHPGQQRMIALARNYVYWPNIDAEIREYVRMCADCAEQAKAPIRTDLCSWPKAERPWQRVHIDYALHKGENYLVCVDAFSKWPEIIKMQSTTAEKTILALEGLCSTWGAPETIVSDNGTQFTSLDFKLFCELNGITHLTSSPYFPMSNGQAERFVDTLKRSLRKMEEESSSDNNLRRMLAMYRSTPLANGKTPAELFIGRPLRTTLSLLHESKEEEGERDTTM